MKRQKKLIALAAALSLGAALFFAGCGGSGGNSSDASVRAQATKASEVIGFSVTAEEADPTSEAVPRAFRPDCTAYDDAGILATADRDILQHEESFTDGTLTVDFVISNPGSGGWVFDWFNTTSATVDILAVVINSSQGGYLYVYDPPVEEDFGLHAAEAGANDVVVWHKPTRVSFCYTLSGGGNGGVDEFEGCTLGYWGATKGGKNDGSVVHGDSWVPTGYTTSTTLDSVFAGAPSGTDTLLMALHYKGGPTLDDKKNLLLKQAVAAVLNAAHPDVGYPKTAAEVVSLVDAALASGDQMDILELQMTLDLYNNLGCPLN